MVLTQPASTGATTLYVDAYSCGLGVGSKVDLGTEVVTVAGFGSLLLEEALQFSYSAGAVVKLVIEPPSVPPQSPPAAPAPPAPLTPQGVAASGATAADSTTTLTAALSASGTLLAMLCCCAGCALRRRRLTSKLQLECERDALLLVRGMLAEAEAARLSRLPPPEHTLPLVAAARESTCELARRSSAAGGGGGGGGGGASRVSYLRSSRCSSAGARRSAAVAASASPPWRLSSASCASSSSCSSICCGDHASSAASRGGGRRSRVSSTELNSQSSAKSLPWLAEADGGGTPPHPDTLPDTVDTPPQLPLTRPYSTSLVRVVTGRQPPPPPTLPPPPREESMPDVASDRLPPSSRFGSSRRVSSRVSDHGRASERRRSRFSPGSTRMMPRCSLRPCTSCAAFSMSHQRPSTIGSEDEAMVVTTPRTASAHGARWSMYRGRRPQLHEPDGTPPPRRREPGAGKFERALQSGDGAAVVEAALQQQQEKQLRRQRWAPLVTLNEATGALEGGGLEEELLRLEERIARLHAELAAGWLLGPLRRLCCGGGGVHAVAPLAPPAPPTSPIPPMPPMPPMPPAPPAPLLPRAPPQKALKLDGTAKSAAGAEPAHSAEFAEPAPPLNDAGACDGQPHGGGALIRPPPRRPTALPPALPPCSSARLETMPSPFERPLPPIGARPLPALAVERPRPPPGRPPPRPPRPPGLVATSL